MIRTESSFLLTQSYRDVAVRFEITLFAETNRGRRNETGGGETYFCFWIRGCAMKHEGVENLQAGSGSTPDSGVFPPPASPGAVLG